MRIEPEAKYMAASQKKGTPKTLLVKRKIDQNQWSPRVFFLTHSHMVFGMFHDTQTIKARSRSSCSQPGH